MRETPLFLNDELQDPSARAQGGSDSATKHPIVVGEDKSKKIFLRPENEARAK
jgi:hypothetical protein